MTKRKSDFVKLIDTIKNDTKRQSVQISPSTFENLYENTSDNNKFNRLISYGINSTSEFDNTDKNNIDINIINEIAELIIQEMPKKNEINEKSITEILEETNNRIILNKKLLSLIGSLKNLKLSNAFSSKKHCLYFWINAFNYLLLFTIFYKKWYLVSDDDWKYFFKNVKYKIDNIYFSFNDMQYIIFKKPLFFSSGYKSLDEIKKFSIEKISGEKKFEEILKTMIPYIIYIPVKKFNSISLFDLNKEIDEQINLRKKNCLNKFIYVDENKNLHMSSFLIKYEGITSNKGLKKLGAYLKMDTMKCIEEKKFKKGIVDEIIWKLNFEYLYDD